MVLVLKPFVRKNDHSGMEMVTYRAVFNCVKKLEEAMSVSDNTVSSLVVKKGYS